jgi:hypothetical protein
MPPLHQLFITLLAQSHSHEYNGRDPPYNRYRINHLYRRLRVRDLSPSVASTINALESSLPPSALDSFEINVDKEKNKY